MAYASKAGSTRGIAEFIAESLRRLGLQAESLSVDSVKDIGSYDAFVVGSAVYMFHWLGEAKEFVSRNREVLATKPVWLFSSGPTGAKPTDSKGRDLREVSGPSELEELRRWTNPRDHHVFFGAFYPERLSGATGWFARRVPKDQTGDFRDWGEIEVWATGIGVALQPLKPT